MALVIDTVAVTSPDSTGNQEITASLGGLVPSAVIFKVCQQEGLDGGRGSPMSICTGFVDGTTQVYCANSSGYTSDPTNTKRKSNTNGCIYLLNHFAASGIFSPIIEASFVSFAANKITINWSTVAVGDNYAINCIFIAGVPAEIAIESLPTSITTKSISGISFAPKLLFAMEQENSIPTEEQSAQLSYGFACYNGAATKQACHITIDRDALATSNVCSIIHNNAFCGARNDDGTQRYKQSINSWNSDGITYNQEDAGASAGEDMAVLLVGCNPNDVNIIYPTIPTSTGDEAYTGAGFVPKVVHTILGNWPAFNTNYTDGTGSYEQTSMFKHAYAQMTGGLSEDGSSVGDTNSMSQQQAYAIWNENESVYSTSDGTPVIDSDGFTINFTSVGGAAAMTSALCMQDGSELNNLRGNLKGNLLGGFQ